MARVDAAVDAPDALRALRDAAAAHRPFAAALLDMQMPGLDGLGLAREICAGRGAGRLPSLIGFDPNIAGKYDGGERVRFQQVMDEIESGLRVIGDRSGAHMDWALLCEARGLVGEVIDDLSRNFAHIPFAAVDIHPDNGTYRGALLASAL